MSSDEAFHGSKVVILDFGSQYTQVIARRVRESRVYSEILPFRSGCEEILATGARGIILSGGPASVLSPNAPQIDPDVFKLGVPILGICYGVQLMAHHLGGSVEYSDRRAYGAGILCVSGSSLLFEGLPSKLQVWNSHGDKVTQLPAGFESIGYTENSAYAVIQHCKNLLFGLQFHPEVAHTPLGKEILENFLYRACGCSPDWTMGSFIEQTCREIRNRVGDDKVVLGLSGGVDSSAAAQINTRATGDQLTCIFVNNGLLRSREPETVQRIFRENFHIRLKYVDAAQSFLEPLRQLFKDEVRQVGLELELPREIVFRQPFPGPGLAVRILGEITEERLEILRQAGGNVGEAKKGTARD